MWNVVVPKSVHITSLQSDISPTLQLLSQMPPTIFRHSGPYNPLRFIEAYTNEVSASLTLSYPDTRYYSPTRNFFDTTNKTHIGATAIKAWMLKLFSPISRVDMDPTSFLVLDESQDEQEWTVCFECMVEYFLKDDGKEGGEGVPILAPRIFVFTIGEEEAGTGGFDGLQFRDVKLYWDTALVSNEMKRRATTQ
jgi:hypothetical protein